MLVKSKAILQRVRDGRNKRLSSLTEPVLSRVNGFIPTGCMPLDLCIGGGIPIGRQTHIYGDTSTGKSLLTAHIMAEAQMMGGTAVLFDTETTTSEEFMRMVGVDVESVIYSTPDTIEEMYEDFEELLDAKKYEDPDGIMLMVWDTVAATSTDSEIDAIRRKGLGAATMGVHARVISQLCRVVTRRIARANVAFVFVNQTRQKIGVLFGPNTTTFGGKAIPFYSSVCVEMRSRGKIEDKVTKEPVGIRAEAGISKNKIARPFRRCNFDILFDQGINEPSAIMEWMKDRSLVTGSSWKSVELLDGKELKFRHREWEQVFYDNETDVRNLLLDYESRELDDDEEDE